MLTTCRSLLPRTRALSSTVAGSGSLAVIFGGFGVTQRQLRKHEALYEEHGFDCMPIASSIPQLISPATGRKRGAELASAVQQADAPTVVHAVSGGFWTALFMLSSLEPKWRERNIRAIMFDSCPPKSDVYAFGGWLAWLLQTKTGVPARLTKPIVSHAFHPVRPIFGINSAWTAENDMFMYGDMERGARARSLPSRMGHDISECQSLVEAAAAGEAEEAHLSGTGGNAGCIIPRQTACLFVRGRNDPVLEPQYVDDFCAFLKARSTASVEWHLFEKAQHAMAVVEAPEQYKKQHIERLLAQANLLPASV